MYELQLFNLQNKMLPKTEKKKQSKCFKLPCLIIKVKLIKLYIFKVCFYSVYTIYIVYNIILQILL